MSKVKDCQGNPINVGDTVVTQYLNIRTVAEVASGEGWGDHWVKLKGTANKAWSANVLNLTAIKDTL